MASFKILAPFQSALLSKKTFIIKVYYYQETYHYLVFMLIATYI